MKPAAFLYILIFFVTVLFLLAFWLVAPAKARGRVPLQISAYPEPLGVLIDRIATESDIHPSLALNLVRTESRLDESALSKTNAVGLAQVLRSTARSECGITKLSKLAEPETNLRCGFKYLRKLKGQFGTWRKALIAYNAGPSNLLNPKRDPKKYLDGVKYADGILSNSKIKESI